MESNTEKNFDFPPLERKKRKDAPYVKIVLILVLFLLCGYLGYWLAQTFLDPLVPVTNDPEIDPAYVSSNVLNILLMGIDQRENEPARADTIILASIDLRNKEVCLLSIPRDTRVEIPGKGISRKINYAHAVGGTELAVQTVEKFLNVPVHYYIETNFEGFAKCIDILGGITINVEEKMYFPEENIDLKPGLQKLDGADALSYVRWRSDGKGDIGRIERQQKFFKALTDQALRLSTVWKLPELLNELNTQVQTDMKVSKMLALAGKFRDLEGMKLTTEMVPGVPDDINYGGSYWIADQDKLDKMLKNIYADGNN